MLVGGEFGEGEGRIFRKRCGEGEILAPKVKYSKI